MNKFILLRRALIPSRTIGSYIAKLYIARFFLILIMLVAILQSLDLLNRSEEILSAEGASRTSITKYIMLRSPELLVQFIPFASLLASLFTFAALNQSSEITIMRAGGLGITQILIPVFLVARLIAGLHFLFQDFVAVDASKRLAFWQMNNYAVHLTEPESDLYDIWLTDGIQIVEAKSASHAADRAILSDVSIFLRNEEGLLDLAMTADLAVHDKNAARSAENGWSLYGLRRFDLNNHSYVSDENYHWEFNIPLERIFAHIDNPNHATISKLTTFINSLEKAGQDTTSLWATYFSRIAKALASIIMPLLAISVAFAPPRAGARIGRLVFGMGIGFVYFVFENYMNAMGSLGIVPPLMAAFAPLVTFMFGGMTHMLRQA